MKEENLTAALFAIARAITADASPSEDAQGVVVSSLTEAVMGLTKAMSEIADAVSDVAHCGKLLVEELRESNENGGGPFTAKPPQLDQDANMIAYFEDKGIL